MRWLAFVLFATPALAECPANPDIDVAEAALFTQLLDTGNEMEARLVTNQLWLLWSTAPDEHAQNLLNEGRDRMRIGDYGGAIKALDALTAYCPGYAEGHNQRAFVAFLSEDYETALPAIDRALAIRPAHLGALTGKALTLMRVGRDNEAQIVLRRALRLNPWLSERHLLREPPGDPL